MRETVKNGHQKQGDQRCEGDSEGQRHRHRDQQGSLVALLGQQRGHPAQVVTEVMTMARKRAGPGSCAASRAESPRARQGSARLECRHTPRRCLSRVPPDDSPVRLWALSDLHISHPANREALARFPAFPDDWLILAGDATDGAQRLGWLLDLLTPRFRQIVWVPGNHELWTVPDKTPALRGVALYERLVGIARARGALTPEDPYPVVELRGERVLIAPLFLLYDYSFRPRHVPRDQVVRWAHETGAVCSDEYLLHPDPFPDRDSWCAARCESAAARLAACPAEIPKVLINHFPLEEEHAVLPRVPRFTPWCGTRRTRGWHRRFNACAVVYGHLHIRKIDWLDGVPFQEVSLGYPHQWDRTRGCGAYLREVTLAVRGATPR